MAQSSASQCFSRRNRISEMIRSGWRSRTTQRHRWRCMLTSSRSRGCSQKLSQENGFEIEFDDGEQHEDYTGIITHVSTNKSWKQA